jgi:hypothetical protein
MIPVPPAAHRILLEEFALDVTSASTISRSAPRSASSCASTSSSTPRTSPPTTRATRRGDYDFIRHMIHEMARTRRFNLQETFAGGIYAAIAARPRHALTVRTRKPDVYPDCAGVGVVLSSH